MPTFLVDDALAIFRQQKRLAERAMEQLTDGQLHEALDPNTNCIAVIAKHLAGNMRSRWTDFLTSDGEKPWRDRDDEFVDTLTSRDDLMRQWDDGWTCLFTTLESLAESDLGRLITIRGKPHTVPLAILRQIDHYGYHVGQIVLIARILAKDRWTVLSIPRGGSKQYNERMWKRPGT